MQLGVYPYESDPGQVRERVEVIMKEHTEAMEYMRLIAGLAPDVVGVYNDVTNDASGEE